MLSLLSESYHLWFSLAVAWRVTFRCTCWSSQSKLLASRRCGECRCWESNVLYLLVKIIICPREWSSPAPLLLLRYNCFQHSTRLQGDRSAVTWMASNVLDLLLDIDDLNAAVPQMVTTSCFHIFTLLPEMQYLRCLPAFTPMFIPHFLIWDATSLEKRIDHHLSPIPSLSE